MSGPRIVATPGSPHPGCYRGAIVRRIVPFFDEFELLPTNGDLLLGWPEIGSDVVFAH